MISLSVQHGSKVKVHYTGSFSDGTVFDTSENHDPIEFVVGKGTVVPGFEKNVLGLKKGQEKEFDLHPSEAYGERNTDLVKEFPKEKFPQQEKLIVGGILGFTGPDGMTYRARVEKIMKDNVTLDFNHLLAGKTLHFKIKLIEITNPT